VVLEIMRAGPDDQERVTALFELYIYEFSEMLAIDVGDGGRFVVRPLDKWFGDAGCHAFLLRVEGQLAGFAMVEERSHLNGDPSVRDMDQFFVLRKYRRHGVGERAAVWLFGQFPGRWEVREVAKNEAAAAFWRRVIGRYTNERFEERIFDDDRWHGPVQFFDTRR
jgi:predicted acetyltransferase